MKTKQLFITLALGLGLTIALLLVLDGSKAVLATSPICFAQIESTGITYNDVQAAVDAASEGDLVKVAGYCSTVHARPPAIEYPHSLPPGSVISQVLHITKTLDICGGYTVTNWLIPDPEANPTTLDAQGQGRVIYIAGEGEMETLGIDNLDAAAGRVYTATLAGGEIITLPTDHSLLDVQYLQSASASDAITVVIDGFRITGGDCVGLSSNWGNEGWDAGGGIYVYNAEVSIENSTISNNNCLPDVPGVDKGMGGGVYIGYGSVTISDSRCFSNTAALGGCACGSQGCYYYGSPIEIYNTTISHNQADGGGGIWLQQSPTQISASRIISNRAGWGQAGLCAGSESTLKMTNSVVANNDGVMASDGMEIHDSSAAIVHCTIADNSEEGIVVIDWFQESPSLVAISNTIVAGHSTGLLGLHKARITTERMLWNNQVNDWQMLQQAIITTTNNYWGDPSFVDPGSGDYHISPGSGAIDKGVNAGVYTDIDADPRPMGLGFDIGADEIPPYVDLNISKIGPAEATTGSVITFTITLSNTGTADAIGVIVSDILPPGLEGPELLKVVGVVAKKSITFTLPATVTASAGATVNNTVFYFHSSGNGSANWPVEIVASELEISKTGPVTATTGSVITYTVALINPGTADATGVVVTDVLPIGLWGPSLQWTGDVGAGEFITFTLPATVTAQAGTTVTNTVFYSHSSGSGSASWPIGIVSEGDIYLPIILKNY